MSQPGPDVTRLLAQWSNGDAHALEEVTRILYAELRLIAASYFRAERKDHTLQPTALISEAYLRLIRLDGMNFTSRNQFLALVAKVMRQILVDHARQLTTVKRGSGASKVQLDDYSSSYTPAVDSFLILDDALTRLTAMSERQARIIELRYFAGLGVVETAEVLGISAPTVSRDQRMAEAWLNQELRHGGGIPL